MDIVQQTLLGAHRFQYILSGARHPHFVATLASLTTDAPLDRIHNALTFLAPAGAGRSLNHPQP